MKNNDLKSTHFSAEIEQLSIYDYDKRLGYNPDFLGSSYSVPHPYFRPDLKEDIALLKDGSTILDYTHFSIVMSKSRRLAYYTVVNIDGALLKEVKRGKDSWYIDPRIDACEQTGPELYAGNDLDRGHLVRRQDPIWGEEANQANEDTFHFTNCSPQHKDLNQKTWLDLEDYLLNNTENFKLKATVFTGPVFGSDDPDYRGIRIPKEFWKLAVMVKKDGNLSASAYLQSQANLIRDLDFSFGDYKTYQVPVTRIEELTGLDFGELRKHDPMAKPRAAMLRIVDFEHENHLPLL
ncbi:DNA/RNA non-specific endonuclease [Mesobacillus foraminis]|uniref:Endonuclease G n=1 Tax=Mesobacillus foraminis TaxID=279826 RepID=A0A4R2BJE1_9BACI|nr:DNA/RNA non-specific endonuclease [Mesobacillus foraminis]TCN27298.1 endonuclease G [Mesobacillus foraminis]